jgi:branched-chain amino acid transport system substrate-binding protein
MVVVTRMKVLSMIAALGASLALAACGSDDESSSTTGAAAAPTTTAAAAAAGSGDASTIAQSTIDIAAKYVGVAPGKVDPSLPPFKIGFTNQQGGTPAFPEMEHAADSTVKFINDHLGGVQGHKIELQKCYIVAEEDGQKCAGEFLGADLKIGNQGLSVVGNAALYKTVNGKFPFIVSAEGGGADVTSKHVYQLDPGGIAMLGGMAEIAKALGFKSAAVISSDNPAGRYGVEKLLNPRLKELGMTSKTIYVPDTGTTPDYASALQAAGASSKDTVFVIPANVAACISVHDAMKQLSIDKKVMATYTCYGNPFPEKIGDGAANWYTSGFTVNPRIEADPEAAAYRNVMAANGQQDWTFNGNAVKEMQDLLLITKFATEIGYDNVTPAAMDKAIQSYRGPGFLVQGDIACDGKQLEGIGVCATEAGKSTYKDGAYVPFEG